MLNNSYINSKSFGPPKFINYAKTYINHIYIKNLYYLYLFIAYIFKKIYMIDLKYQ